MSEKEQLIDAERIMLEIDRIMEGQHTIVKYDNTSEEDVTVKLDDIMQPELRIYEKLADKLPNIFDILVRRYVEDLEQLSIRYYKDIQPDDIDFGYAPQQYSNYRIIRSLFISVTG